MSLRGQDDGYAMAALLVAMAIMAVLLTAAMPTYKQMAQREKEEELIFRGQQYARAIALFQRKYANAFPPNVDVLVRERFIRKKYKDPVTNDDFQPITQAQGATPGSGSATAARPGMTATSGTGGASGSTGGTRPLGSTASGGFGTNLGAAVGGIMGVASKSKDISIKVYNGRTHYNEWVFMPTQQMIAPGAAPGTGRPGQPGQPGSPSVPVSPGGMGRPGQPGQPGQRTSPSSFGYRIGPNGEIQSFGTPPTGVRPGTTVTPSVPAPAPARRPGG